jgi:metal-responsive CopG/Arc/MetJ family transcriptional regulator
MKAMKSFLIRLPESLMDEVAKITEETYCSKSQWIRQSIARNLDVVRNVEMPLLRRHHQETTASQLKVLTSISNERTETP